MRACVRAAACAPGAEAETREEKRGPLRLGREGDGGDDGTEVGGTRAGNPLGEADGPPRARGGEGGAWIL